MVLKQIFHRSYGFLSEIRRLNQSWKAPKNSKIMDRTSLIIALQEAVQDNNYLLFVYVLCLIENLFFAYNGQNYARHLTFIAMF